mmetsp:Transcript_103156/g.143709  ORF Transcript_103156/g.143709 Transcript_103156/m.143709 type:complete len:162 (-) Transcript_103156:1550-2035(-)
MPAHASSMKSTISLWQQIQHLESQWKLDKSNAPSTAKCAWQWQSPNTGTCTGFQKVQMSATGTEPAGRRIQGKIAIEVSIGLPVNVKPGTVCRQDSEVVIANSSHCTWRPVAFLFLNQRLHRRHSPGTASFLGQANNTPTGSAKQHAAGPCTLAFAPGVGS